jgi:hypothetical protein
MKKCSVESPSSISSMGLKPKLMPRLSYCRVLYEWILEVDNHGGLSEIRFPSYLLFKHFSG